MSEKFKIETESIKGTKFSIEFEIEENGFWKLSNLPYTKKKNWNWTTTYYYNRYPVLKEMIFVITFLRKNKIRVNRISARDLSEIICMLLEKSPAKRSITGNTIQRVYPLKVKVLTHVIKDLEIKLKEI
jgi:hypothetical protein